MSSPDFVARLERTSQATPDRVAVRYRCAGRGARDLTHGELFETARRHAAHLVARGVRVGDVVALMLDDGPVQPCAFLGCLLVGAVPTFLPPPRVKIDPARYATMVQAMLRRAGGTLIIASAQPPPAADGAAGELPWCAAADLAAPTAPLRDVHRARAEDVAFLQHSSGTTGLQKGVAIGWHALDLQLARLTAALALGDDDWFVSWLPLYHDMGLVACLLLPLYAGCSVTQIPTFDWLRFPASLFDAATADRATIAYLPNFAFHYLAARARPGPTAWRLDSMRAIVNCSEPIDGAAYDLLHERCAPFGLRDSAFAASYAAAEAVFAITQTPLGARPVQARGADGRTYVSSGAPMPGVTVHAVDGRGDELPEGTAGQLVVACDYLMTGYHGDAAATRRALRGGTWLTGDNGFVRDGEVYVAGRSDDVIIVAGKNVYPQDVERVAGTCPGVQPGRVAAFGVHRSDLGTHDVIVVAERSDPASAADAELARRIRALVARSLDVTVGDVFVRERGWLVKSTSGKISRSATAAKARAAGLLGATPRRGALPPRL